MNSENQVIGVEKKLSELLMELPGYFLVEISVKPTNNIKVFVDADQGATIDQLSRINRALYKWMEENRIMLPVVSLSMNYKKPARYDDLIRVKTIFKSQTSVKIEFDYEIYNEENELLTIGNSVLVFVDMKTGRPTLPPSYVVEKLLAFIEE